MKKPLSLTESELYVLLHIYNLQKSGYTYYITGSKERVHYTSLYLKGVVEPLDVMDFGKLTSKGHSIAEFLINLQESINTWN